MCWRGYSLYDCTTEFRLFWAQSKLAESGAAAAPVRLRPSPDRWTGSGAMRRSLSGGGRCRRSVTLVVRRSSPPQGHLHRFRFAQLPVYPATPEGIAAAYSPQAPPPFVRDGLHFLTKEANYEPGHTPLALAWKDAACSPYFIDTDAEGVVPEHQRIVLQLLVGALCWAHGSAPLFVPLLILKRSPRQASTAQSHGGVH